MNVNSMGKRRAAYKANNGIILEPLHEKNQEIGFPTRSVTNRAVQSQKQARSLKF